MIRMKRAIWIDIFVVCLVSLMSFTVVSLGTEAQTTLGPQTAAAAGAVTAESPDHVPQTDLPGLNIDIFVSQADTYLDYFRKLALDLSDEFAYAVKVRTRPLDEGCSGDDRSCDREMMNLEICLNKLGPDRTSAFFHCYEQQVAGTPRDKCLDTVGIPLSEVKDCLASHYPTEVLDLNRSDRQKFADRRLPLIVINNTPYNGQLTYFELKRAICQQLTTAPSACESLPECLSHSDCFRQGQLSLCENAGTAQARCVYSTPQSVPLTVIIPEPGHFTNQNDIIKLNERNFPGTMVQHVSEATPEGQALIRKYDISLLPAYIFDPAIEEAYHFKTFREGFYRQGDRLLFKPERVGATVFCSRKRVRGRIEIVLSSHSVKAMRILHSLLDIPAQERAKLDLKLYYIFPETKGQDLPPGFRKAEMEEDLRQLLIYHDFPQQFHCYIKAWLTNFRTTYWDELCLSCELDPVMIKELATGERGRQLFRNNQADLERLPIRVDHDMLIVLENRELVWPADEFNLKELLTKVTR